MAGAICEGAAHAWSSIYIGAIFTMKLLWVFVSKVAMACFNFYEPAA